MHLDSFGNSLAVEYIFLALGPIKQLLLASKSVPYYPKLSLSTPFYGIDHINAGIFINVLLCYVILSGWQE